MCDLIGPFDVLQPAVSHHLTVLREALLASSEWRATWVYYPVLPEAVAKFRPAADPRRAGERLRASARFLQAPENAAKVVPLLGWKRALDVAENPATRLLTRSSRRPSACPAP
ncbi:hypothetical protein ACFYZB_37970 [Streptomyces sp. NPDC001852]|uniref:hypothetical protein n=1 Tax=Streptomyces sp. NPDC001852 TaxID=3364619 RepID=UPI0036A07B54